MVTPTRLLHQETRNQQLKIPYKNILPTIHLNSQKKTVNSTAALGCLVNTPVAYQVINPCCQLTLKNQSDIVLSQK
uniref:Uncharacterized protein n=1 Tax=Arundo donax TaxID=35708 RepID=A0A0A8ZQH4_ARUDO